MARYRRKPEYVDAEQFFPERLPWPKGVKGFFREHEMSPVLETSDPEQAQWYEVPGGFDVQAGDYVIRHNAGLRNELIVRVRPNFFERMWERVPAVEV